METELKMASVNFFDTAKVIPAPVAKGKKDERAVVQIAGLEDVAAVDALIKTLEALKSSLRGPVDAQMRDEFIAGSENFFAFENSAEASAELRKRSVASVLTAEEVALLEEEDIPVGKVEKTAERFVINPAYMADQELLGKVSAAMSKIKGMPIDFIQKQAGLTVSVVSEETFKEAMATPELAEKFIDVVGVLGLKPKLNNTDLSFMVEKAKKLLGIADAVKGKKGK